MRACNCGFLFKTLLIKMILVDSLRPPQRLRELCGREVECAQDSLRVCAEGRRRRARLVLRCRELDGDGHLPARVAWDVCEGTDGVRLWRAHDLGFGRIIDSEISAPNLLTNLV